MWCLLLLLLYSPADFDVTFRAGLLALQQNDLTQARAQLESAAQMRPNHPQVWVALARTFWKLHQVEAAESAALKAGELGRDDPAVLYGLGFFYSEKGDFERAAGFQARYLEKAPSDSKALSRTIELYLRAGKPKAAIDVAAEALSRDDRADVRSLLGKAYEADGQTVAALREMREAIRLNPYEESYYFNLARDLLQQNDPQDAIQVLEQGKKVFARSAQLELTLGVAYYGMRRFADAIDAFLRTIHIDPRVEQSYVFLGRILDQSEGKLPEVIGAFAAFAKANSQDYLANFLYGKALAYSGQREQAESLLHKSVGENGAFWESHFELGAALERRRDLTGAEQEFARSAELNPKSPMVHYRLARVYDRLGKTGEARAEYALHQTLTLEENASIRRRAGGIEKLELPAN